MSMKVLVQVVLLWCCAVGAAARAAGDSTPIDGARADREICAQAIGRPCIALVLGGGGARGGAHLGVLRYLEEQRIPIDLIVGTSIGSFVGGLYASGKRVAEIEEAFRHTDWNLGYQDDLPRSRIPIRRQQQIDSFPIQLDIGLGREGFKLPRGFLQGQGMKGLVDRVLGVYPAFDSFDRLPIPFRAVAADIESGEEVVLGSGDLATAIQASMSIPGVVRPTELEGRLLVDGGIANNLPVSVARGLGAEVVIAVDIGSQLLDRDELGSGLAIVDQLAGFLTLNNVRQQKSLLSERDVYLSPDIGDVTTLSFERLLDAVEPGYREALARIPGAGLPRVAEAAPAATPVQRDILIEQVVLNNQTRLADDYLLHRMGFVAGQRYTLADLQAGADRLYGQGTIARINTALQETVGGEVLAVDVQEKEWGPGYLDFKLGFEDNFDNLSRYQVGASFRLTNLSPYGAEWFTAGEFGSNKSLTTDLYWPFATSGFYGELGGGIQHSVYPFIPSGSDVLGEVVGDNTSAYAGVGWDARDSIDVLLAYQLDDGKVELPFLLAQEVGFSDLDFRRDGARLRLRYDTLDDASFPREGAKLVANLYHTRDEALGDSTDTSRVDIEFNGVMSLGRNSLRTQLRFQSAYDDAASLLSVSALGGFLNLSGNVKDSIFGNHVRFASVVYTYELAANDFGAINLPLYLGVSAEAGNAWLERDDIDYGDLIHSGSVFLGWDSPLGPAYLAYGRSDTGQSSFYAFLGVLF